MTIAYRSRLLLVVSMCGVGACADDRETSGPLITAVATIENKLPVDGCSYPVVIDEVQYAPDAASEVVIRDLFIGAGSTVTVRIDYRLTGRTGNVQCELGPHPLPEIALVLRPE